MSEQLDLARLREIVREVQRGDLRRWWEACAAIPTLIDRLAAVEALVRELHIGGDLTPAGANAFLAVLQSDPSEASTDA